MVSIVILLLHLLLQISCCFSSLNTHLFTTWCEQHGKRYSSDEEKRYRLSVFEDNLTFVMQHNNWQNFSYTLALNDFADLTHQEFKTSHLDLSITALDIQSVRKPSLSLRGSGLVGKLPSSVDWRNKKSQASCSTASVAVSVTGAIQGIKRIIAGSLSKIKRVTMEGYHGVPSNDNERLLQAVAVQPVHVGICANEREFQFYSKFLVLSLSDVQLQGIFSGPCSSSSNHAVTIVGYDSENGADYWIVKNSWGRNWGMNGDMYILRNSGNQAGICGINTLSSYPIKTNPNPFLLPSLANARSCDFTTKCRAKETCCCIKHFILCLSYRCCELDSAVCCDDHKRCCPNGYICDVKKGTCLPELKNSTTTTEIEQSSFWYSEG
ncbi:hypothetical protein AQUCO_01000605v1 [Aquilegia coerulea]|uniref:SMB domain-containing protein n=1 Tax=Aquilegia coerulea TaxID=218851 RepID=A0A2G5EAQ1_AQUCA|nr:hypothetical protein AQUCO_01000605v1 [Aquilegia coerulea]